MFNCSNYTIHCYDIAVEFVDGINLVQEWLERVLGDLKVTLNLKEAGIR